MQPTVNKWAWSALETAKTSYTPDRHSTNLYKKKPDLQISSDPRRLWGYVEQVGAATPPPHLSSDR